ncbi:MAG UNVERIFIED_CONTAM: hypothetical protein LVR18_01370 [Planctomycetaceae bacterium]|jgi:hypothetical protein
MGEDTVEVSNDLSHGDFGGIFGKFETADATGDTEHPSAGFEIEHDLFEEASGNVIFSAISRMETGPRPRCSTSVKSCREGRSLISLTVSSHVPDGWLVIKHHLGRDLAIVGDGVN